MASQNDAACTDEMRNVHLRELWRAAGRCRGNGIPVVKAIGFGILQLLPLSDVVLLPKVIVHCEPDPFVTHYQTGRHVFWPGSVNVFILTAPHDGAHERI